MMARKLDRKNWNVYERRGGYLDSTFQTWEIKEVKEGWLIRHRTVKEGRSDESVIEPAPHPNDLTGLAKFEMAEAYAKAQR